MQAYEYPGGPGDWSWKARLTRTAKGSPGKSFTSVFQLFTKPPTTSAPSIGLFQNIYEKLFQEGVTQILSIHVASAFSGIHDIACVAAESSKIGSNVFDSQQVSLGLGFQVLAAAEAAARGLPIEEIIRSLTPLGERVHFMLYSTRSNTWAGAGGSIGLPQRSEAFLI